MYRGLGLPALVRVVDPEQVALTTIISVLVINELLPFIIYHHLCWHEDIEKARQALDGGASGVVLPYMETVEQVGKIWFLQSIMFEQVGKGFMVTNNDYNQQERH